MTPPLSSKDSAFSEALDAERGEALKVIAGLLDAGDKGAVVDVVRQILAEVDQLKRLLAQRYLRRTRGEAVSSSQLKLMLDGLDGDKEDDRPDATETEQALIGIAKEAAEESERRKEERRRQKEAEKAARKGRDKQIALPPGLRRVLNKIDVAEEDRNCPVCGDARVAVSKTVSYAVTYVPAEIVVRVDEREVLACTRCEGNLVRAETGPKIVEGGKFDSSLVAKVLVDKYRDGLPLHRIKRRFTELGLPIAVSTLADQVAHATTLLSPLAKAARAAVLGASVMHLDGTGLFVLDRKKKGNRKLGQLWGYVGDGQVAYLYNATGRKRGQRVGELGPEDMLSLRSGYTVSDGGSHFKESFKRADLVACGCNAHARRYFKKALDGGDKRATVVMGVFKRLYQIEADVRGSPPEEILAVRQEKSAPVYADLIRWAEDLSPREPPKSKMGRALSYLLNNKDALQRFLEHPLVPIDNSIVEQQHIRVALTRKNYLFAGSDAGGDRAAIAYTVLGCCNLADVDPYAYLTDVLPRLAKARRASEALELLPLAWKAAQG